uniref:Uncharacterized protein n=1 Tax=Arundo donax TaxID=35708 RepID=A0A0A8ZYG7_ARUDO
MLYMPSSSSKPNSMDMSVSVSPLLSQVPHVSPCFSTLMCLFFFRDLAGS